MSTTRGSHTQPFKVKHRARGVQPRRQRCYGHAEPNASSSSIRSSTFVTPSPLMSVGQGSRFGSGAAGRTASARARPLAARVGSGGAGHEQPSRRGRPLGTWTLASERATSRVRSINRPGASLDAAIARGGPSARHGRSTPRAPARPGKLRHAPRGNFEPSAHENGQP